MGINVLKEIQEWFHSQCNGDWEHLNGITIETVDNPGWHVTIDLTNTNLNGLDGSDFKMEASENDWYMIIVKDDKFIGTGDPLKLEVILEKFIELARKND